MGPYLSTPDTKKDSESGHNDKLTFSAVSMQGWRNNQEDAHIADIKLPNGEAIFGVFDGHGGAEVAKFVAKKFVDTLKILPEYKSGKYEAALSKCFVQLDDMMVPDKCKEPHLSQCTLSQGCTSCVAILTKDKDKLVCANSGDSRCILMRG